MQHLEKLFFQVGMIDQITDPTAKIQSQIQDLTGSAKAGFQQMAVGAAGVAGAGYLMFQALKPAIEMDRVLGEVKSLGVVDEELDALTKKSLKFSVQYGKSATDFVQSSYDIQSAIGGLVNGELAEFTNASNVLAAATKADAGTITSYMGTMYGIFKDQAQQMGKAQWVQQLTGQTAQAVQMFKTTGSEMSGAFTSLGAEAQSAGVGMSEQMAILGTLQATMSGSEAGTKYRAFLSNIGKAQDKLGMQFTDSQGRLMPMLDILESLRGQFGDTLDVAESTELKKAFGSNEAVGLIKLLMNDTEGLASSMDALGNIKGMSKAEQMAGDMVDPWQRLGAGVDAIRISMGSALLPVVNELIDMLADGASVINEWTQKFPNLTKYIGFGVIGFLGLTAAVSAGTFVIGAYKTLWAGLQIAWLTGKASMLAMSAATAGWNATMMLVNATLWANPITLIVLGVVALVAAVAAAIYWWDDLKESFGNLAVFKMLGGMIDWVIEKLNMIPGIDIDTVGTPEVPETLKGAASANTGSNGAGGIGKQITTALNQSNNSSNNISIHTSQPAEPAQLDSWLRMAAP